jgi:hypothetical protein
MPLVAIPEYCIKLVERFPQLKLSHRVSRARRVMNWVSKHIGRGYQPLSLLDRFDAVCEAPGGHIHPLYMRHNPFRHYPRVRRRALLFQSIEAGAVDRPAVRDAVAGCELVIARTSQSAKNARKVGAKHVVDSADAVFLGFPRPFDEMAGVAVALRLPNIGVTDEYLSRVWDLIEQFDRSLPRVDFTLVEEPIGRQMKRRCYGTMCRPNTGLYYNDTMYNPFVHRRDAVISCRLHTTLLALLHGNRKILQFHIEPLTNKTEEILADIKLTSLKVHRIDDLNWSCIHDFLDSDTAISEHDAITSLNAAKAKAETGLDAFQEWLESLAKRG